HVVENEIERPQDMIVKSVVNKSGNKVYIIKSIDLKMPLDDIAEAKGLEMIELIHEIEAIVNAGTKLNIDYYLHSIMDQEHIDDIYNYFRDEADTESIEDALKELGENEYSEEEVRLVRVKFIAEMGN
ncbi:MAG TPA: ATP-dependent DNA helicase RecQ, partial [Bacteroidales bacterium]|nr:ATP-dependent DNA helicase RecQ [Bacteroidales bacterium]